MKNGQAVNSAEVKKENRRRILHLLHVESCSRAEIARRMGLTRAGVSVIINQLLEEGIVKEGPSQSANRGRPSICMMLNPDAAFAAGITLKRDRLLAGLVSLGGEVLCSREIRMNRLPHRPDECLEQIAALVTELLQTGTASGKFLGIGISTPGPLDAEKGRILNPPNFSRFQNVEIVRFLEKRFGCDAVLENDILALALTENVYVLKGKYEAFLEIVADGGLGGGLIWNGRRFRGMDGFGHISINLFGEKCPCGNRGCVELYASLENIVRRASRQDVSLTDWKRITDRAWLEDPTALLVVNEEAEYLAEAIVSAANVLSFDAVVLGESLAYRAGLLIPEMQRHIQSRVFRKRKLDIMSSALSEKAYVLAGAELIIEKWIEENNALSSSDIANLIYSFWDGNKSKT